MEVKAIMRPEYRGPIPQGLFHTISWKWQRALCPSVPVIHGRIETTSLELVAERITRLRMFFALHLRRAFLAKPSLTSISSIRARQQREHVIRFTVYTKSVTCAGARLPLFSRLWLPHRVLQMTASLLGISFVTSTFNTSSRRPK